MNAASTGGKKTKGRKRHIVTDAMGNLPAIAVHAACILVPETLAKRVVCIILLAVGVPNEQIIHLTGFCNKTVKSVHERLSEGDINDLFKINSVGRKSKTTDVENAIVDEINTNQYHSRQQIADE